MLLYVKINITTRQSGIVLVTVLIFLQLFAILNLYALEASWLEVKMSRYAWQSQEALIAAENALSKAEKKLIHQIPHCLVPMMPTSELMMHPLSWWQLWACTDKFYLFQYYYVTEDLGEDSCADIEQYAGRAHYYRITLLSVVKKLSNQRIILQSTVIKPDNVKQSCNQSHHTATIGRQMWRELKKES